MREFVAVMNDAALAVRRSGLLGLVVGIVVTALVARVRRARALAAANASHLRPKSAPPTRRAARGTLGAHRGTRGRPRSATAEGAAARAAEARSRPRSRASAPPAAEKLAVVHAAEAALREAFQALPAKALQDNNAAFLALAKTALGEFQERAAGDLEHRRVAIDELVKPIRESLERVGSQLQTVEKERVGAYSALVRASAGPRREPATAARRDGASRTRAPHAERTRPLGRDAAPSRRRARRHAAPLRLPRAADGHDRRRPAPSRPDRPAPGGRHLVVDAKAPLLAYLDALEATDESLRDANLKEHARQVRDHVSALGAKTYWAQFQPSPELVVMFLPAETFLNAALQHDPTLIEFAAVRRVVLASPTSLIALLYAVAHGWQQQAVAEGVLELSRLGRDLYDRLRTMVTHFEQLRRGLNTATTAYNDAMGSLEKRVLVAARRFKDLNTSAPELPVDRAARAGGAGFASIADADEDALPVDDPDS